jgi:hypothetical protein
LLGKQVPKEQRVFKVKQASLAKLVFKVKQELRVTKEPQALWDKRVPRGILVHKEILAFRDKLVFRVTLV